MQQYLDLLTDIIENGTDKGDRTGTGTRSVFGRMLRFDLNAGFPLLTTKKVHLKSIIHELLWFLSGDTNNNTLKENGVRIWDEWALEDGRLGPIYSKQWVNWEDTKMIRPEGIAKYREQGYTFHGLVLDEVTGHPIAVVRRTINQIQNVIDTLKKNPNSRRIIVSAWNPADLPDESISPQDNVRNGKAALPACHTLFQFYVQNGKLSCMMLQRSCDSQLGAPFNIASYALLTMMIAQQCDLELGEYIHVTGDTHLYQDHLQDPTIVQEQLSRDPRPLPKMRFARKPDSIFDYKYEDFILEDYNPHPAIKAKVSV